MAFSKGDIAAPFIQVKKDENGVLQDIKFVNDDNFNFAYDVVDKMAKKQCFTFQRMERNAPLPFMIWHVILLRWQTIFSF